MFQIRLFDPKTLKWWHSQKEDIDLEPHYQRRGGLWSAKDKAFLIDSILNDYDIPKVYIADFTILNTHLNKKGKFYAIVDGKQRFEAIFDFFEDKLTLNNDFVLSENPDLNLGGLGYKDLRINYPKLADKIDNYPLTIMSVITDEESKINELFVRLNRNKPLIGAEIRGAMKGIVPKLIKEVAEHDFFKNRIKFNVKRKQDENVAAKLLLIEFRGKFVDTKRVQLDRFVEEGILSETTDFKNASDNAISILSKMSNAFLHKDPLLKSSAPITIYYWLFRSHFREDENRLREFLVYFERLREDNRKISRQAHKSNIEPDNELLNYDILIRSANDQGTMVACYAILEKRYRNFA